MTSTPQPGDQNFLKLEDEDLFLVNKDLDGDGLKYDTFSVPYSTIVKDIQGPQGEVGATGPEGKPGLQGNPGTSIELKGIVDYYEDLFPIRAGFTGEEEGAVYIVRNDYSGKPSGSYSGILPGTSECADKDNPSDSDCERNVAYVFSYSSTNYFGQSITDVGPGNFVFIRIGPLTGPVGATGYTSENYDTVRVVEDSDTMYSIAFEDKGYKDDANNREDGDKYYDADLGDYFANGLPPSDPIGDIRGATGPWFDDITRHGKLIKKENPDWDDSDPTLNSWVGTKDEIPYSDDTVSALPTYEQAYDEAKLAELDPDSGLDYNPQFRYYNYVDIEFTSSNTANPDVASDPHDVLTHFRINDLVGATGANTGSQGPRGETGAEGATGPYYAIVEGNVRPDNTDGVTSNNPGEDNYTLTFKTTNESDPEGKLIPELHLKQDLMGPAIDEQTLINILNNIVLPEPDTGEWEGPYVHRGSGCGPQGTGDNVNENIYGRKTIRDRLAFNPCDSGDRRMIDFPANVSVFSEDNVYNGSVNMDALRIYSRSGGSNKHNAITIGIRRSSGNGEASATVGIKVQKPQSVLECKGNAISGSFTAVANGYFDSGQSYNSGKFSMTSYSKRGISWRKTASEAQFFTIGQTSDNPCQGSILLARPTEVRESFYAAVASNTFKIANLHVSGNNYVTCSNAGVIKKKGGAFFSIPDSNDSEYTIGEYADKDVALAAIKSLKPRLTTYNNGEVAIKLCKDDIPTAQRSNLAYSEDSEERTGSLENVVSLLLLSIQKLEDRISVLENQSN